MILTASDPVEKPEVDDDEPFPPARGSLSKSTSCDISQTAAPLNRNILALDLGTKTGWALGLRDGRRSCGTEDFTPMANWHPAQRFTRFKTWLLQMLARHQIHAVVYEKVVQGPHRSGAAGDVYGGFLAVMLMCAESHNIVPDAVHTMTVKKHVTGSGRADKPQMIVAIKALGYRPDTDNAADAAGILELAIWAEQHGADVAPARATVKRKGAPAAQRGLL